MKFLEKLNLSDQGDFLEDQTHMQMSIRWFLAN